MSIGIKGAGEEILETHPLLDKLESELDDITSYWNGEDNEYQDANGEVRFEDDAHCASEAIEKIKELKELLTELDITF